MSGALKAVLLIGLAYNALTALLTWADKRAAKGAWRRLPESRLLLFALTGGGAGVLIVCYAVRHKTKKRLLLSQIWFLTLLSYSIIAMAYTRFLR